MTKLTLFCSQEKYLLELRGEGLQEGGEAGDAEVESTLMVHPEADIDTTNT